MAVVARLGRARAHIDAALEAVFAEHGLSAPGFAVLVTLARLDRPAGVPQRTLMDELGLTSGTISVRMDRLEEQGLVERRTGAGDRRNSLIVLTEKGRALFERIVPAHLENERRLLIALDDDEQVLLATLLRKLLVGYEGTLPEAGRGVWLGLTLAPAHVTIAMRRAPSACRPPPACSSATSQTAAPHTASCTAATSSSGPDRTGSRRWPASTRRSPTRLPRGRWQSICCAAETPSTCGCRSPPQLPEMSAQTASAGRPPADLHLV